MGKMGDGYQKVQTSSYKRSKSWGYNVQHGDYSYYCIAYLKVVKREDVKHSQHKKKILKLCMLMDVNETYCGDHFAMYINIKALKQYNVTCQLHLSKNVLKWLLPGHMIPFFLLSC